MINSESTGITINGKPYGNPDRDILWNIREGIKQMTEDGDEMLISGLAMKLASFAVASDKSGSLAIDVPFAHSCGPGGYSDCYYIRRTGL